MSAHKAPFELYQGPLSQSTHTATSGSIAFDRNLCVIPVDTTLGATALTLTAPTKAGIIGTIVLVVDGGDLTLTVTNGYNFDGDTGIVFDDVKDRATFLSYVVAGTYYWGLIAQEGTNAAVEEGSFDTLVLGGTTVTATGAEINQLDGAILADMTPGTGISTGTGTVCEHQVTKVGGVYKTEILLDITGLNSGDTAGDIIGKDGGTANCHLGQILAAVNGTITGGRITCLETPTGGDPDVDFWGSVDEATGAQDAAIASLTGEEQLINHGDWTAGDVTVLTAEPDADGYLYMACGVATDADYTAGKFLVELWGV
jgi:hypothetical protein